MTRARIGVFLLGTTALALLGCGETTSRATTDAAAVPAAADAAAGTETAAATEAAAATAAEAATPGASRTNGRRPAAGAATETRLVERDVEAPQVFETTESGLWDGRPSLGGVWVASPDAVDPERVIIRNPANGKFVIGALFRRERLNPGPPLQISSDAAAALGILAGAPTNLHVTALRREEAAETQAPDASAPLLDSTETVAAEEPELVASAEAAIDRATGNPTVTDVGPAPDTAAAPATATDAPADAVAEDAPKKRKGWLFGRKKPAETETEAAAAEDGAITTTPLDGAAAPVVATPVAATPAPAAPAASSGRGGSIQIGFFSVEANADRAVSVLAGKGVAARKITDSAKGKTFWRVVADAPDRSATLTKVKAAGFTDAYFTR